MKADVSSVLGDVDEVALSMVIIPDRLAKEFHNLSVKTGVDREALISEALENYLKDNR